MAKEPKVTRADSEYKPFSCPLNGKWNPSDDPLVLGEGDFSSLNNMRYTPTGIRGILGWSSLNYTLPNTTYVNIRAAHHFMKQYPDADESHIVYQAWNAAESTAAILTNDTAIGSTGNVANTTILSSITNSGTAITLSSTTGFYGGDFALIGTEVVQLGGLGGGPFSGNTYYNCDRGALGTTAESHSAGASIVKILGMDMEFPSSIARMVSGPYGSLVYCNGKETKVWGGNGMKVGRYLDKGGPSYVRGDDAAIYECIKSNTSTSNDEPGATPPSINWATYWKAAPANITTAISWQSGRAYSPRYSYDYTVQVNNSLDEDADLAEVHNITGQEESATTCLLVFDGNVSTDSSGNGNDFSNTGVTFGYPGKRGSAYASFDGTSSRLYRADSSGFDFTDGTWTIDFWIKSPTGWSSTPKYIYNQWLEANHNTHLDIFGVSAGAFGPFTNQTGYFIALQVVENAVSKVNLILAIGSGSDWVHVAFVENGDNWYGFVNGAMDMTQTSTDRCAAYDGTINIGCNSNVANHAAFNLDEFRVTNTARWTAPFTPPSTDADYSTASSGGGVRSRIYLGAIMPITGIDVEMDTVNTTASSLALYYSDGVSLMPVEGQVDMTSLNSITLARSGLISFHDTTGLAKPTIINDVYMYWYFLDIVGGVTAGTKIKQITLKTAMQKLKDMWDGEDRTVSAFFRYESGVFYDETLNVSADSWNVVAGTDNTLDKTSYSQIFNTSSGNFLYFGLVERGAGILVKVIPSAVNANTATMLIEDWDGDAWTSVGSLQDGTSQNGATMSRSGYVTWNPPDEEKETKTYISAGKPNQPFVISSGTAAGPFGQGFTWMGGETNKSLAYGGADYSANYYYYRMSFSANLTANTKIYFAASITAPKTVRGYKYPCMWGDRLVLANEPSGNPNALSILPANKLNVLNGADYIRQPIGDDTPITAVGAVLNRFGADLSDLLVILKKSETWIGALSATESGVRFAALPVTRAVGCPAPGTFKVCDMGMSVAPGVARHVAIWLSNAGVAMYDQAAVTMIHEDIQCYFDPWRSTYINYDLSEKFSAYFDTRLQEYHLFVATGASTTINTELVYSLRKKAWFPISRYWALNGAVQAIHANGSQWSVGFVSVGGFFYLETGAYWAGTGPFSMAEPVSYSFRTGAKALAGLMVQTKIRKIRLLMKAKTYTNEVTISDYIDSSTTAQSAQTLSMVDASHRVAMADNRGIRSVHFGPGLTHEIECSVTNNTDPAGFEPLVLGGLFKVEREEMGG